ncbi:MAG: hypothetical protein RMI99_04530 [Nitrososphaerota archaeon]|nr:hypothetical protein [Nitrososphaerota archaeon]
MFFSSFKALTAISSITSLLNDRIKEYKHFSSFVSHLLAASRLSHNVDSILVDVYGRYVHNEKGFKLKTLLNQHLQKRLLTFSMQNNKNNFEGKTTFSPFIETLWTLLRKVDIIDEKSLRGVLLMIHQLCRNVYNDAKRIKTFIRSEKLKFQVLQIATAMTLSFIIKTSMVLTRYPHIDFSLNVEALIASSLALLLSSLSFVPFLHLHQPSLKNLALSLFVFFIVLLLPV